MSVLIADYSLLMDLCDLEDEFCDWLDNHINENISSNIISEEILRSWLKIDERAKTVPLELREFRFCSNLAFEIAIFKKINSLNHFEEVGKAGFSSRVTVKSANLVRSTWKYIG